MNEKKNFDVLDKKQLILSQEEYKKILREEYLRCAQDPVYFCRRYCVIQTTNKGKILFNLYDFQVQVLKEFLKYDYNIILKSRQLGISTLCAAYSLWLMLFNSDTNILVIAKDQMTSKNLVTKVRVMHDNLPQWLQDTDMEEKNKLSLRFRNGSQIKALSSSPTAGRSDSVSLLILDEAAFIRHIEEIWASAQQTLATGGKCIVLSTPNGIGNWFYNMWADAENGLNGFNTIRLDWTVHPERTAEWRKLQEIKLGKRLAAQECIDGDCLVDVIDINNKKKRITMKELYENRFTILKIKTEGNQYQTFLTTIKKEHNFYYKILFSNNAIIKSSASHIFIGIDGSQISALDLKPGDKIKANNNEGYATVLEKTEHNEPIILYDIICLNLYHTYYANDILVHNCDANFITSGNNVIEIELIQEYENTYVTPPSEQRYSKMLWIWKNPEKNKRYIVSADVARGDGSDYCAFHVLDLENVEQVAEFKGKLDLENYANIIYSIGKEYNDAYVAVENNGAGVAVLQILINKGYHNLHYTQGNDIVFDINEQLKKKFDLNKNKKIPGFTTSVKTRPLIISSLEEYIRSKSVIIHSIRTIDELRTFVWVNGKPEAQRGRNDDLVLSLSIGLYLRNTAIKLIEEGLQLQRKLITMTNFGQFNQKTNLKTSKNSWIYEEKGEKFDLRELL